MWSSILADIGYPPPEAGNAGLENEPGCPIRTLAQNELLFETGDVKTNVYRVESGALCIYVTRSDLTAEVIEFVLAGDYVGMGFLERHACNARATVESKVTYLPLDALDRLIEHDERAKRRFDDAVQREFAFRRDTLVNAGRESPSVRLASFLVAISQRNNNEGQDPLLVGDALNCAVVADYLAMSVDLLALTLVDLEMQGLVEPAAGGGLRLLDVGRLEALANLSGEQRLQSDLPSQSRASWQIDSRQSRPR